ncbi:MAG: class I SAM-dependent methyltransferase [Microbacteriaceae bacterium]
MAASRREWNHNIHYFPFVEREAGRSTRRNALDVGTGDGMLAARLARHIPAVIGLDLDARQVAASTERYGNITGLSFVHGDVLDVSLDDAPFDFVVCSATIHHLPLDAALSRLAHLTAPGGTLVVVGLARDATVADRILGIMSIVMSRIARTRRGWYDHGAPMNDPTDTWNDVRATATASLSGVHYRRRLYWRYTLVWNKPISA